MIGICTDSSSQLPELLAARYGVEVVPVTVTINEHEYLEGVDLDVDEFYEMLGADPPPHVSTSQPSAGQFAAAYDQLLQRGCDEILSVHVAASTSGTLNSARLAARMLPIPVRLVDSGTAGFGVSCCVWAAGDAIANGADLDDAVHVAESLSPHIGAVFVAGQSGFVRTGNDPVGVPVMTAHEGRIDVVARVPTLEAAAATMAGTALDWGSRLNVAVGWADPSSQVLSDTVADSIYNAQNVAELARYRIGPSVGVYAGLGTVGCFMFPAN
ncbi:MAG TPA: DegV family protein [Ilumatobacteraceae bacterium]|jgi:fatty acid-binding protein DegV